MTTFDTPSLPALLWAVSHLTAAPAALHTFSVLSEPQQQNATKGRSTGAQVEFGSENGLARRSQGG